VETPDPGLNTHEITILPSFSHPNVVRRVAALTPPLQKLPSLKAQGCDFTTRSSSTW